MQGVQGMMQGNYEAHVARQNAALETERARQSIEQGRVESRDFYRSLSQTKGQQVASLAANGIDVGYGTALQVQEDTASLGNDDAQQLYKSQLERLRGFDFSRSNDIADARAAKFRGRVGLVNSVLQAGSSLMGGFQQMRSLRPKLGIGG